MHCASLGEFEQGRPVLEKLRERYPAHRILLTFFSPSGYEIRRDFKGVDWVFYLPLDGPGAAPRFFDIVQPSLVIFVKYEYWYYYLKQARLRGIPLLLISAFFRRNMIFFKWYGYLYRRMLSFFDHLFVQNEQSLSLLASIGLEGSCTVAGDTRFDRVIGIAAKSDPIPEIEKFTGAKKAIIAGSTWNEDEETIAKAFSKLNDPSLLLIIAPHEIHEKHLAAIERLFPHSMRFSKLRMDTEPGATNCLIIDNIGMLSRLYKYAYIAYVGGGFNKSGIHNILEAAVYGKPVIWGPHYEKFNEAIEMIALKTGFAIKNDTELTACILDLLQNDEVYKSACIHAAGYVNQNAGATNRILGWIQEKRLLTN
jgi:3-deoxy-D-manno-octulosonic-acid transferase